MEETAEAALEEAMGGEGRGEGMAEEAMGEASSAEVMAAVVTVQ